MNRRHSFPRVAILSIVILLGGSAVVQGQLLPITSNGSLGAWNFPPGYTYKLHTGDLDIGRVACSSCQWELWNGSAWVPLSGYVPIARAITQPGGPEIAVFDFTTFNLPVGVTLLVEGNRAGAIAATGNVTIAGTVVVTATGGAGAVAPGVMSGLPGSPAEGPGAGGAGQGPGWLVMSDTPYHGLWPVHGGGGGGGGAVGAGIAGSGGTSVLGTDGITYHLNGGAGGVAYIGGGSLPLRGGSGGGSGGGWRGTSTYADGGRGGAGGGALLIETAGSLVIGGSVNADGGFGMNEGVYQSYGWMGGGGGGGGGYLAFQVNGTFVIQGAGVVYARGGVGGLGSAETDPYSWGGQGGGGAVYMQTAAMLNRGALSVVGGTPGVIAGGASDDADHDGLPDTWEGQMGLNPAVATGDDGPDGDPDHDGKTNLEEYLAGTHPRGFFTRYFAEGAIIPGFFEVDLALLNVDPLVDGHVLLRYQREGDTTVGQVVAVPALGRRTVRVNDNPVMGMPSYTAFSTVIESDVRVVADRTMIWDDRGYGSHAETSVASPAQTWYLAEGATHSGFDLYYLIQNPNASAVTVRVTYLRPSPLAPVVKQYVVAGSSRKTIYVNGEGPELAATDVSAKLESLDPALPVIVERAMYLTDGWGHQFGAGHESAAVTAPSTHWFLAEGATVSAFGSKGSFFDLYILIANPNATASTVTMTYLLPDGTIVGRTLTVAGNSRQTVYVNAVDAKLADTPVSTVVTSTQPVIVERAMWWPGPTWTTWYEAHNSPGTTETGTLWALAEGESGGSRAAETYILIANTSAFAGQVRVTLLFEEGTPATSEATFDLLPNSRRTIYAPLDFASAVPAGAHRRYGVLLESLGTTPAQIVVERAMYANDTAGVTWAAGTNAVGTRLR